MPQKCYEEPVNEQLGFTIHATKKLLDRLKQPVVDPVDPATELGNWYATLSSSWPLQA